MLLNSELYMFGYRLIRSRRSRADLGAVEDPQGILLGDFDLVWACRGWPEGPWAALERSKIDLERFLPGLR